MVEILRKTGRSGICSSRIAAFAGQRIVLTGLAISLVNGRFINQFVDVYAIVQIIWNFAWKVMHKEVHYDSTIIFKV